MRLQDRGHQLETIKPLLLQAAAALDSDIYKNHSSQSPTLYSSTFHTTQTAFKGKQLGVYLIAYYNLTCHSKICKLLFQDQET